MMMMTYIATHQDQSQPRPSHPPSLSLLSLYFLCPKLGSHSVDVDPKHHRVTVSGYVTEKKVMKSVQKTGKRAEKWPYIENHLVAYPHIAGAYDKKAPPGFVKNVPQAHAESTDTNERLMVLFSEENAQGCHIM